MVSIKNGKGQELIKKKMATLTSERRAGTCKKYRNSEEGKRLEKRNTKKIVKIVN